MGDTLYGQWAVYRLAARHGDGIVEENLVGDVGVGGDRLPDRKRPGVIERAVTEILENMLAAVELRTCDPVDTFAAHLDQAVRVPSHPARHEMAADAGQRFGSFGYFR